jgi:hypothetical protein
MQPFESQNFSDSKTLLPNGKLHEKCSLMFSQLKKNVPGPAGEYPQPIYLSCPFFSMSTGSRDSPAPSIKPCHSELVS